MGNEKFRQEAWPFLLLEIARLHTPGGNGSCTQSCVCVCETFVEDGYFSSTLTQQSATVCMCVLLCHKDNVHIGGVGVLDMPE